MSAYHMTGLKAKLALSFNKILYHSIGNDMYGVNHKLIRATQPLHELWSLLEHRTRITQKALRRIILLTTRVATAAAEID